jgi:RNA polymerase sigma-70 factor (ECF subfamily)
MIGRLFGYLCLRSGRPIMHITCDPRSLHLTSLSDHELVQAALGGVEEAYAEIVRRHKDRLVSTIRGDISCGDSAEDVVQDAFVRAFAKLESFRGESSLYTWLFRIALNSRRSYIRDRRRAQTFDSTAERYGLDWCETASTPSESVESKEECEQVRAALARLDDHHRAILMLREFDGCDYQAISEALKVNLGTVRSRLNRARAQLRKELAGYWTSTPQGESPRFREPAWEEPKLSLTN